MGLDFELKNKCRQNVADCSVRHVIACVLRRLASQKIGNSLQRYCLALQVTSSWSQTTLSTFISLDLLRGPLSKMAVRLTEDWNRGEPK